MLERSQWEWVEPTYALSDQACENLPQDTEASFIIPATNCMSRHGMILESRH